MEIIAIFIKTIPKGKDFILFMWVFLSLGENPRMWFCILWDNKFSISFCVGFTERFGEVHQIAGERIREFKAEVWRVIVSKQEWSHQACLIRKWNGVLRIVE